jgi:hypothetical protein
MHNPENNLLDQVEAFVRKIEIDDAKWIYPSSLGFDIEKFQHVMPILEQMEVDRDISFVGRPHHESITGNRYIDAVLIKRRR